MRRTGELVQWNNKGGFGFVRDIVDDLRFAGLIANGVAIDLDPRCGIHIAKAADKQRNKFAVDLVDPGADFDRRFAMFGKFGRRHARCL